MRAKVIREGFSVSEDINIYLALNSLSQLRYLTYTCSQIAGCKRKL